MAWYSYLLNSYSVLLYIALVTPYKVAYFDEDKGVFFYLDIAIDILFVIDIIMSFFVAYFNEHQELIVDRKVNFAL
ncbi:MAG: hypothetical protein KDE33_11000 [Bacteroidetes bacterium]|nr:hypothetical protein [Bacteroidota bacterium]